MLISDVAVTDATRLIYSDEELTAFLAMNVGVKRAAAAALDAVASNELQVSKVIKTQDLTTNAEATAAGLRKQAQALRDQADRDSDDAAPLSIVDFDPYVGYRRRFG